MGQSGWIIEVFAAGQRRSAGPGAFHFRKQRCQLGQGCFGKLAVGGELAAEHREQGRIAAAVVQCQGVVAGDGRWLV